MEPDSEKTFVAIVGHLIWRWAIFLAAVWVGGIVGVGGGIASEVYHSGTCDYSRMAKWLAASPVFLFAGWPALISIVLLLFAAICFIDTESVSYCDWVTTTAIGSLLVMLGCTTQAGVSGPVLGVAWIAWAVLLVMAQTGLWLVCRISRSRRARRLEYERLEMKAEEQADHCLRSLLPRFFRDLSL